MMRQQVGAMSARGGMMGVVYSVQEAIETLGLRGTYVRAHVHVHTYMCIVVYAVYSYYDVYCFYMVSNVL
jgi:hypothetical protein